MERKNVKKWIGGVLLAASIVFSASPVIYAQEKQTTNEPMQSGSDDANDANTKSCNEGKQDKDVSVVVIGAETKELIRPVVRTRLRRREQ